MDDRKMHPTCHKVSLTTTTRLVAFGDMLFGLFGLIWFVLMLSRYDIITLDPFENISNGNDTKTSKLELLTSLPSGHSDNKPAYATNHKVISLTLVAFYTVVNLSVFAVLLVGVHKRSPGICLIWFNVRCAIFVFKTIILIIYLIGGRPLFSQLPFILSMIVHLYGLWVVNCYVTELRVQTFDELKHKRKEELDAAENVRNTDMPNGIEILQQKRLKEGLENPVFGKVDEADEDNPPREKLLC